MIDAIGTYQCGSTRFSYEALHLICCCALYTGHTPEQIQALFQGQLCIYHPPLTINPDLFNVSAAEIRACFWELSDGNHDVYSQWLDLDAAVNHMLIYSTVRPLVAAELWYTVQDTREPIWSRD